MPRKHTQLHYISSLLLIVGVTIGWMLCSLYVNDFLIRSVSSLIFSLTVPGFFIYRMIVGEIPKQTKLVTLTYSVGLSIFYLMLAGLIMNQIYIALNLSNPFSTANVTFLVGISTLFFVLISWIRKPLTFKFKPKRVNKTLLLNDFIMVVALGSLPLAAVGGANTLNNGGGSWLALLSIALVGTAILLFSWQKKSLNRYFPYALYSMTLSILLATSMRGWHITGHDIMQEYQVFQLTIQHAMWKMAYYQDAYMACLSITILPTMLQKLTGIDDPYIYKFVFQLFAALLAPLIYQTLVPFFSKKIAFLAAVVFITFPAFLTDITMLNRQETALVFLVLSVQAALDKKLGKVARNILVFLYLSAMILSHYSTSYVTMGILLGALVIGIVVILFTKLIRKTIAGHALFALFNPLVIIGALLVLITWNSLITQTSSNIGETISGIGKSIPSLLSGKIALSGNSKVGAVQKGIFEQYAEATKDSRPLPDNQYYPEPIATSQQIHETNDQIDPENTVLSKLGIPFKVLSKFYSLNRTVYAGILTILIVLGIIIITIRRKHVKMPSQYFILGVSALAILGAQLVLPSSAINYGLLRIILQILVFLALPVILISYWFLSVIRIPVVWIPRVIGTILFVSYIVLSGFISHFAGGDKPALALSNSGLYYQAYYTHQDEISADVWIKDNTPVGSRIYSDEFARRKMIAYSGVFSQPTLLPEAIPIDSYVYLSEGNTKFDSIPVYYNGQLTFYKIPYSFLDNNKNLVYTTGAVDIYK